MTLYRVTWEMDIDAGSRLEAAVGALQSICRPDTIATVFDVVEASKLLRQRGIDLSYQTCAEETCRATIHARIVAATGEVEWLDSAGYAMTCRGGGSVHRPAEPVG